MTDNTTTWHKSSRSGASNNCVEIALLSDGRVAMRDSKNPAGPVLTFTTTEWAAFIDGVRAGEFTPNAGDRV